MHNAKKHFKKNFQKLSARISWFGSSFLESKAFSFFDRDIFVWQIILVAILLFATYLRLGYLDTPPFWVDESISSVVSANLFHTGTLTLGSGISYNIAPIFHATQTISFAVFGLSDFAARIPSVIFGLLTILLFYFIGKEYSREAGLASALICAVFFVEVFYSRQARFYQLFQLLFFATVYFLYKSKDQPRYLIATLILFVASLTTQVSTIILAPFILIHIIIYSRKYWPISVILAGFFYLASTSAQKSLITPRVYSAIQNTLAGNINALSSVIQWIAAKSFIDASFLFLPMAFCGGIFAANKNLRLFILILLPALIVFIGTLFLELIAFRYTYLFFAPVILFAGICIGALWKRFGIIMLCVLLVIIFLISNLIFPMAYSTILAPVNYGFSDPTAPELNLKGISEPLLNELKKPETVIITHFSPIVEWYIKKPTFVLPFSLNGKGADQVSFLNDKNQIVDIYSGAPIFDANTIMPARPYYVVQTYFATSKLRPSQKSLFVKLIIGCAKSFYNSTAVIYSCT